MYKLTNNGQMILRVTDGAYIPVTDDNTDYQVYLKWLDAGNTPEAADAAPAKEGNTQ